MYGLALCGLWAARYGTFPPRPPEEKRPEGRAKSTAQGGWIEAARASRVGRQGDGGSRPVGRTDRPSRDRALGAAVPLPARVRGTGRPRSGGGSASGIVGDHGRAGERADDHRGVRRRVLPHAGRLRALPGVGRRPQAGHGRRARRPGPGHRGRVPGRGHGPQHHLPAPVRLRGRPQPAGLGAAQRRSRARARRRLPARPTPGRAGRHRRRLRAVGRPDRAHPRLREAPGRGPHHQDGAVRAEEPGRGRPLRCPRATSPPTP